MGLSEALIEEYSLDPSETVFVGDTIDTDIEFGNNSKFETLLVLTGNATEEDATQPGSAPRTATYFTPSVRGLEEALRAIT